MSIKPKDEIYITCPSNVPSSKANTPADYTTDLPCDIELPGEWEVALIETHYFNDWKNFEDCSLVVIVQKNPRSREIDKALDVVDGYLDPDDEDEEPPQKIAALSIPDETDLTIRSDSENETSTSPEAQTLKVDILPTSSPISTIETAVKKFMESQKNTKDGEPKFVKIPAGYYPEVKDVCDTFRDDFVKEFNPEAVLECLINAITGQARIQLPGYFITIFSSTDYFAKHLGHKTTIFEYNGVKYNWFNPTISSGLKRAYLDDIHSIFVYSDIIDYQIVGNSKATLLGVLPVKGKHLQQQSWQFNPLQYMTVPKKSISTIQLQICTPKGDPVPFLSGDTLCRLHFKRKIL